jgi:hypothetical protein
MLGITTEQVGQFSAIALASGGSADGMTNALERMGMGLQRAKDGTGQAAAGFKALGIDAKTLIGLPLQEVLDKVSDKFAGMENGLNKTAIAMAIMGRGGADMIPVLNRGAEGMAELGAMATRSGTAMSEGMVGVLTQMHETFVELGLSIKGIGITLAVAFGPAVTAIAGALADLFEWFNKTINAGGTFKGLLDLLVEVANGVASSILTIVLAIEVLVQSADMAMREVRDILHGNLGAAKTDFAEFQASVLASSEQWMTRMKALWVGASKPEEGHKREAPSMDLGSGNDPAAVAAKGIEAEIKVLQIGLAEKKELLDQEVSQHQISQAQKFATLQGYVTKEYEEEKALLNKELLLYDQGSTEYAAVKGKMLELDAKYSKESTKVTGDAIKAQQAQYQAMFDAVQTAFNNQLRGLLAGTTSWKQAFKTILGDLIIAFIQAVEKMGFEWLAGEIARTAATTTGVAARTGAETAGAAVSSAVTFAGVIKSIMASAAQTFAGIFGFLSPVLGPAAAGPAVAGEASVAAVAAAVPSLDVGTPWVVSDGLAKIHRGERIVPAAVNKPDGSGGGGGDTHHHWSVSAMDGPSVARFFKQNASVLNSILGSNSKLNPSGG